MFWYYLASMKDKQKREIITFDAGNGLRQHLESQAVEKGIGISKYVKSLVKRGSKFKPLKKTKAVKQNVLYKML